jgi:NAD(P)-dependent dehydrogenase (short-subunit alcohol dehydrogenase family)
MARIIITGANRGIGLELARALAKRGDEVIAACRKPTAELKALKVEIVDGIDVADDAAVARLAAALARREIDLLINNAGILSVESLEALDLASVRRQFEVNTLGPLRVTKALIPNLAAGAKIAIVTSRMGSIADNGSGGYYGYRISKAGVNMAGVTLARNLKERGIIVVLLHPGFVRTGMTGGRGTVDPKDAATGLIARIDEAGPESSGHFFHAEGGELPW